MNVYSVKFNGYYPVGACAVVTATSPEHAKSIMESELKFMNLPQDIPIEQFELIRDDAPTVKIVLDGEY